MSTFSGLNTALSSLYAQQRAIDVTGQNVSNVNTDGYSRQRTDMTSLGGNAVPAIFSTSPGIGAGVSANNVIRIRDMFLEARAHTEHSNSARLTQEQTALSQVEQAFREPGDAGLQNVLADMWAGWSDVANQPQDTASRTQLVQQMQTVTSTLQTTRGALDNQWTTSRATLNLVAAEVNTTTAAIADLNTAIGRATVTGTPANELSDKRDALVVSLAKQIGATAQPGDNGTVNVFVNGTPLVFGSTANAIRAVGAADLDNAAGNAPRFETVRGEKTLGVGGAAAGHLNTLNKIIPTYRDGLDTIAADLAASINAGQASGYDLDGNPGAAFLSSGPGGGPITAANITVALTSPRHVAASSVAPPPPPAPPAKDGTNADTISRLQDAANGATSNYRDLIVNLGVESQSVTRALDIQNVISTQVDTAREANSGVNLDEEMANLVSFQRAYQAAARMVSAIDEALDTLINRTGLVGR
jgi:flagellar hook-associated protein FlgK